MVYSNYVSQPNIFNGDVLICSLWILNIQNHKVLLITCIYILGIKLFISQLECHLAIFQNRPSKIEPRSDYHKPAQLNFESLNGPVHCIADIARIRVYYAWVTTTMSTVLVQVHENENCPSYHSHEQVITWMWFLYLVWNNWYFMANAIYISYPKKNSHIWIFPIYN